MTLLGGFFIYVVAGIIIGFVVSLVLVDETDTADAIAIGMAWPLALAAILVWAVRSSSPGIGLVG